jgi:predicted esterase YcpF (UPF0227 family)
MIIYLHGFGSSGNSPKVDVLKARFNHVFAPELPFDPVEVKATIHKLVDENWHLNAERLIFVGTSLGGFYANYFGAYYGAYCVLVNPSTSPSETLKERLGPNINYMTQEHFMVSLAHLDELKSMSEYVRKFYESPGTSLFLAKDDDVIPYEAALEAFPYVNKLVVTEGGGHRYSGEYWDAVVEHLNDLLMAPVAQ